MSQGRRNAAVKAISNVRSKRNSFDSECDDWESSAVSGSQRRQFVVSIATSQPGTGRGGRAEIGKVSQDQELPSANTN